VANPATLIPSNDGGRRVDSPPLAGLRMTYAERLRWLEETMETLRRWQGLARLGPRSLAVPGQGTRAASPISDATAAFSRVSGRPGRGER
jgi:hypothetical protein